LYNQYDPGIQAASGENGLVGQWKLDGNAKDSTPNGNNGTVTGATLTTDRKGRTNAAYAFANGTDTIALPASSVLNSQVLTISAWIRPTSFATNKTIVGSSSGAGPQLALSTSGVLAFNSQTWVQICTGGPAVPLNTWSHVAVTYDATGQCSLYINGVFVYSLNYLTAFSFSNLQIGKRADTSETFSGSIDDVRVYGRVLSAADLKKQYESYDSQINLNSSATNTTSSGNVNQGLIGYWPYNGNAKDATPYSNNGTVTGATLTTDRKGMANNAYAFSGTNNYISYANNSSMDVGIGESKTIALWMKAPVQSGTKFIAAKVNCAGWYMVMKPDGYVYSELDTDNGSCGGMSYASAIAQD
jgi:hypothetical protein